jgi:hypothetical protein
MTSLAELTLAAQLEQAGIPFEREYRFHPIRRWRFDFARPSTDRAVAVDDYNGWMVHTPAIAIEVEGGSFSGGHRRGLRYEFDCEKHNAAMLLGWQVYRFTPAMVEDGRALKVIREALGIEEVERVAS